MYLASLRQWQADMPYVPAVTAPWLEKLAHLDVASLTPGRHDLGNGNFMNVDVPETAPAATRQMEAHRAYIDIQLLLTGQEHIGYQPVSQAGPVVAHEEGSDNWFYRPDVTKDIVIPMVPLETVAIFTPADGHRCLCAPDGVRQTICKVIMKIKV